MCEEGKCEIQCNLEPGFYCHLERPEGYCCCEGHEAPSVYHNCPNGLWWDPILNVCNYPDKVDLTQCPNYEEPTTCGSEQCDGDRCTISCNLAPGYHCDASDPSAYCFCNGEGNKDTDPEDCDLSIESFWAKCPAGLSWDVKTHTCNYPAAITHACGDVVGPTDPPAETTQSPFECGADPCDSPPCPVACDDGTGYLCDLNDPAGYCFCADYAGLRATGGKGSFYNKCLNGLLFDPVEKQCNLAELVNKFQCSNFDGVPCDSVSCQNGGTCENLADNTDYQCSGCDAGFTGKQCQDTV